MAPGKAAADVLSAPPRPPAIHVGDLQEAPGPWLHPGPPPGFAAMGGVIQQMDLSLLSLKLFQISKS